MSPKSKKILENFAARVHWNTVGHPADIKLFWDFVISAYRHGEFDIPF
jgi:hypothetical protein